MLFSFIFFLVFYPCTSKFFKYLFKIGFFIFLFSFIFLILLSKEVFVFFKIVFSTIWAIYYITFLPPEEIAKGVGWVFEKITFSKIKKEDVAMLVIMAKELWKDVFKIRKDNIADLILKIYDKKIEPIEFSFTGYLHPVFGFVILSITSIIIICLI